MMEYFLSLLTVVLADTVYSRILVKTNIGSLIVHIQRFVVVVVIVIIR